MEYNNQSNNILKFQAIKIYISCPNKTGYIKPPMGQKLMLVSTCSAIQNKAITAKLWNYVVHNRRIIMKITPDVDFYTNKLS